MFEMQMWKCGIEELREDEDSRKYKPAVENDNCERKWSSGNFEVKRNEKKHGNHRQISWGFFLQIGKNETERDKHERCDNMKDRELWKLA